MARSTGGMRVCHTAIKGGERGGPTDTVSGSERCLPRTGELFMHLWEERNWGGWLSLEGSGYGRGFHTRPTLMAAQESITIISESVLARATVHEGDNCADVSSPEKSDSPSDTAIDIRSSGGAPKDTEGAHLRDGPPSEEDWNEAAALGLCLFAGTGVSTATPRWSSSHNGYMTHPQMLPQRALRPDTRCSARDHPPVPGNDHIQKHISRMSSLKRHNL